MCSPLKQPNQLGKSLLVKKSSDILEEVSSVRNAMCSSCKISYIALHTHVSSIIEPKVLCAILNENSCILNAIPVDKYKSSIENIKKEIHNIVRS